MNHENKDNIQTTSSNTTNSIEYEGRTQTVNETVYRESDFKHYELHDVTTDIMYLRKTPEEIQQDLDKEGTLKFYEGITHDGQRVTFRKTEQGWEAPLKDEPAQETNKKAQSSSRSEPEFTDPKVERPSETEPNARKVVLDLQYRIPDNIKTRYHSVGGKFYSVSDHKTVLFEDQGKQLKTALSDPQTVKDMLEVVKAKGWDSIKLSGSKDFRQAMFIEAAAQGIRTSGYNPTAADLQRVEALRERYAQNGITPEMVREQERRQPEVEKEQPRQEPHKQTEQGNSQSETGKPTQEQEQLKPEVEREERIHTQPDAAMLSAADRLKAQSTLPSDRTINASPRADTDIDVPVHSIGREEVPAEVVHQTDDMKAAALNTGFVAAKDHYMQKAQKLSKPNQKKLAMYERGVMDSIRGLEGDVRTKALRNYYEHTAQNMHGTKLKLPDPIQIPSPTQEQQQTAKGREQYSPERGQDPEITR